MDEMESITIFRKVRIKQKQTFDFKSPKCPPAIDELAPFESDLQKMISNIEVRPIRNKFLSKLSKDTKNINKKSLN